LVTFIELVMTKCKNGTVLTLRYKCVEREREEKRKKQKL